MSARLTLFVGLLFLVSLLLAGRLSINVRADPEQKVSGFLSGSVESGEGTPIARLARLSFEHGAALGSQGHPPWGLFPGVRKTNPSSLE